AEHGDAVGGECGVTETAGWSTVPPGGGPRRVAGSVGEKGLGWRRLVVRGTPGHGSMPYGADNALVTAAEIVRRLASYTPAPYIDDLWRNQVATMDLSEDVRAALVDPARLDSALAALPPALARRCHATT